MSREWEDRVESVQVGTVIASSQRALSRWNTKKHREAARAAAATGPDGKALRDLALENVLMSLAKTNPDIVAIRPR